MERLPQPSTASSALVTMFVASLILAVLFSFSLPASASEPSGNEAEVCLVDRTNQLRSDRGLVSLRWSGLGLDRVRDHAGRMRAANELFHSSFAEVEPTLPQSWTSWGEVVGMASLGASTVVQLCGAVFQGFLDSPPHRDLLLSSDARFITVGADVDDGSAWYSVTLFDATAYEPDTEDASPPPAPPEPEDPASGETEPDDPQDPASPNPPPEFTDDDGSIFEADIEWLAAEGITRGCSPTEFCPDDPLTRGQMAAFLVRGFGWTGTEVTSEFVDMRGHMFDDVVARLAEVRVTRGCSTDRFCPDDTLTRGQLAAFLTRALGLDPGSGDHFADDNSSEFEADIEALLAAEVTSGCSDGQFCPEESVTRGQMAAMLRRALDR